MINNQCFKRQGNVRQKHKTLYGETGKYKDLINTITDKFIISQIYLNKLKEKQKLKKEANSEKQARST
jgi:hypothetical protein